MVSDARADLSSDEAGETGSRREQGRGLTGDLAAVVEGDGRDRGDILKVTGVLLVRVGGHGEGKSADGG